MWPQGKECQLEETTEFPIKPLEEAEPCQYLNFGPVVLIQDFGPPEVREYGNLLELQEIDTAIFFQSANGPF